MRIYPGTCLQVKMLSRAVLFIMACVILVPAAGCISMPSSRKPAVWADDNTLRLLATGVTKTKAVDVAAKQQSCMKIAGQNARYEIMNKVIKLYQMERRTELDDFVKKILAVKLSGLMPRKGKVIKKKHSNGGLNCQLIYEYAEIGLRQKVYSRIDAYLYRLKYGR